MTSLRSTVRRSACGSRSSTALFFDSGNLCSTTCTRPSSHFAAPEVKTEGPHTCSPSTSTVRLPCETLQPCSLNLNRSSKHRTGANRSHALGWPRVKVHLVFTGPDNVVAACPHQPVSAGAVHAVVLGGRLLLIHRYSARAGMEWQRAQTYKTCRYNPENPPRTCERMHMWHGC